MCFKRKSIFLILQIFLLVFILSGCSKDEHSSIKKLETDSNLMELIMEGRNSTADLAPRPSLIDVFFECNDENLNYDVFECTKTNEKEAYIAGYLSNSTIELIDKLYDIPNPVPPGRSWLISGVDTYLNCYRLAVWYQQIDQNEHPIVFSALDDLKAPCVHKDYKLVVVLEKQIYNAKKINEDEIAQFTVYSSAKGHKDNDLYLLDGSGNEFTEFIMSETELKEVYTIENLNYGAVLIEKANNVRCVYENSDVILAHKNHEAYFEIIKDIIISPNKTLEPNVTFTYNYEELKTILCNFYR